jgi:hypothetical protein
MLPWSGSPSALPVTSMNQMPQQMVRQQKNKASIGSSLEVGRNSAKVNQANSVPKVPGALRARPLPQPSAKKCAGWASKKRG